MFFTIVLQETHYIDESNVDSVLDNIFATRNDYEFAIDLDGNVLRDHQVLRGPQIDEDIPESEPELAAEGNAWFCLFVFCEFSTGSCLRCDVENIIIGVEFLNKKTETK